MTHRPIEHSYWVAEGKLLAGEYPRNQDVPSSRQKLAALRSAGVKVFIDLTEEREPLEPYATMIDDAVHHRFPITDASVPASLEATKRILDTIDQHVERGDVVYIHCWGGIGRTGLIVGCWLARHGQNGEAALARLRELWQQCGKSAVCDSPETPDQARYIVEWSPGR